MCSKEGGRLGFVPSLGFEETPSCYQKSIQLLSFLDVGAFIVIIFVVVLVFKLIIFLLIFHSSFSVNMRLFVDSWSFIDKIRIIRSSWCYLISFIGTIRCKPLFSTISGRFTAVCLTRRRSFLVVCLGFSIRYSSACILLSARASIALKLS